MSKRENISMSVIRRLPRYYRFLSELKDLGVVRISSSELAKKMNLTASQIRQDFNCFGGFGQQGYGYSVEQLHDEIVNILGLKSAYKSVLIGVGNLGRAVAMHTAFEKRGFELVGVFDNNPEFIGTKLRDIVVSDVAKLTEFCKETTPDVAILCVPREAVSDIAKELYDAGVRNFWNFSHYDLSMTYKDVTVENVHMSDSLMTLCYRITQNHNSNSDEK